MTQLSDDIAKLQTEATAAIQKIATLKDAATAAQAQLDTLQAQLDAAAANAATPADLAAVEQVSADLTAAAA